jgi:hypothetical protein
MTASCGFVDFRPIGIELVPGAYGAVLADEYSPVILKFDTEMQKYRTEDILQISSDLGSAGGDLFWKGNDLYFVPSPPWTAGIRYTISLSGIVYSLDGRELRLERFVSFYAINESPAPLLETYSPADGESVGSGGFVLELGFSRPMERLSVETAFSVEGLGEKKFEWLNDDRTLRVIAEKPLAAWTSYRWTLKNSAKSRDGVPLAKAASAQFSSDRDELLPRVEQVFPVLNVSGRWLPVGTAIEDGLGPGQGIAVEFNKPMGENALRSLRFEPSLAGRTEMLAANKIVFIPSRDPEPETAYTLFVAADAKDAEGLKIGAEYRISFIPDIPYIKVLSFRADGGTVLDTSGGSGGSLGDIHKVQVDFAAGECGFTLWFSHDFSDEEKQNTALKISLNPFFPRTLDPVALRSAAWMTDNRLRMTWEGLRPGTQNEFHYYKLIIPGGKGGINSGGGTYFKEDQYLYLEAVQ